MSKGTKKVFQSEVLLGRYGRCILTSDKDLTFEKMFKLLKKNKEIKEIYSITRIK